MNIRRLIPVALIILVLVVGSRISDRFLDIHYLLDSATLSAETGLVALAMTFVILGGNIDLSVGSNLILTACLTAKALQAGLPIPLAILFSCMVGILLGLVNGLLVAKVKLPSVLATIGTMAAYRGVAQAMLGPGSVKLPHGFTGLDQRILLGLPVPVLLFLVFAGIAAVAMNSTVFGRWTTAVGSNERAAFASGVPTAAVKLSTFALTGFASGVGAILLDSRLGVARHDLAKGMELDAITMVVVGGTAITGGDGSILGTVLAVALVATLKAAMGMANIKAEFQITAIGILLAIAVMLNRSKRFDNFLLKKAHNRESK